MALADEPIYLPAAVRIGGSLTFASLARLILRSELAQDNIQSFPIELVNFRVWNAFQTLLGTPASDDLGIATGAFGTGLPYLSAGDLKAAGATTRYARAQFTLPPSYVAGQTAQIRFAAGMLTTISDTTATLDVECYKSARTTLKTGSDLISTSAQSINSVTFGEYVFTITESGLAAGMVLDFRIALAVNDAATVTAVEAAIAHVELLLDIKG